MMQPQLDYVKVKKHQNHFCLLYNSRPMGATENAGVEKAVDSRGGKCRSKSYGTPTRDYIEKTFPYTLSLLYFPLLHFPPLLSTPAFSALTFSAPPTNALMGAFTVLQ